MDYRTPKKDLVESILPLQNLDSNVDEKGVEIVVEHLSYSIELESKNYKKLLDDINFKLVPGSLTAVMGPSGAGKT